MIYIAHRGLFNGPNDSLENSPEQIQKALDLGFHAEVDVRYFPSTKKWFLGHDEPQYEVDFEYLKNPKFILHCKNLDALFELTWSSEIHFFWHQTDDYTLTSNLWIWTFPGADLTINSIAVLPFDSGIYWNKALESGVYGVCTDYLQKFIHERKLINTL